MQLYTARLKSLNIYFLCKEYTFFYSSTPTEII